MLNLKIPTMKMHCWAVFCSILLLKIWTGLCEVEPGPVCPFKPQCDCNKTTLICDNFDDYKELNFSGRNSYMFNAIYITPRRKQILERDSLNMLGLALNTQPSAMIQLSNIVAFHYDANPLTNLRNVHKRRTITLVLANSTLKFKSKNGLGDQCTTNRFSKPDHRTLFSMINMLVFKNVTFPEPLCPLLFVNANLAQLRVAQPNSGLLTFLDVNLDKRPVRLADKKMNETSTLNAVINRLFLENTKIDRLDEAILHPLVFYNLQELILTDVKLSSIDPGLFKPFKYLTLLNLNLGNWGEFLREKQLEFLDSLNSNVEPVDFASNKTTSINFKNKFQINLNGKSKHNETSYYFPDADFCKFVNFPLNRLVVPYLYTNNDTCSCTIEWLSRYKDKFPRENSFSTGDSCSKSQLCDFDRLKSQCKKNKFKRLVNDLPSSKPVLTNVLGAVIVVASFLAIVAAFVSVTRCMKKRRLRAAASQQRRTEYIDMADNKSFKQL